MQMSPKAGKLSRSKSNPYCHVVLNPCQESPTFRVKQSTLHNMRSNFESSVGINNFNDPNVDDERLLVEEHVASNGLVTTRSHNTKAAGSSVTRMNSVLDGKKETGESGDMTQKQKWASVPMAKPLNLREIKNVDIQEILLREKCSCQHFSIVATPKAIK